MQYIGQMRIDETNREFLKEGTLKKVGRNGRQQTFVFYLFSDMLLWARERKIGKRGCQYKGMQSIDYAID
jgi:hypothetical protein